MRFTLSAFTALLLASSAAFAQEAPPAAAPPLTEAAAAAPQLPTMTDNAQLDEAIRGLQAEWAHIKYEETNAKQQLDAMRALAGKAAEVTARYPNYAEAKIWRAIIVSTEAGMDGGLGAMSLASNARELLEEAKHINPNALEGSVYTSLGSLYHKVPGWPLGFGDDEKAKAYLEQARAINPDGIDPNFFYGELLLDTDHAKEAIPVLEHALAAAPRPGRELADAGRRGEITALLAKAHKEAGV